MMLGTKKPFCNVIRLFSIWFVCFALSPCTIKQLVVSVVNLEYVKPATKTKTTLPVNGCQYSQNYQEQASITEKPNVRNQVDPVNITAGISFVSHTLKIKQYHSRPLLNNRPPKYILYKCLKLDVA